ncbi:MAG: TatD family hydrolase [Chloroflexi bacterium]|nr:TatD family hydrolase [Chloroflexota bacterium]MCA2002424.1 TatD family hydrolase [Chloroflexota bacterium]
MLTDTHCHLDYPKFRADLAEVIGRARDAGLRRMLIPGLNHKSSAEAIAIAERYPEVFAAVGFHPTDLNQFTPQTFAQVKELAFHPKVVAIGEIGLDYYWVKDETERANQRARLKEQLEFAKEVGKPVILHMREENDEWFGKCSADLLEILSGWQAGLSGSLKEKPGVLHSFNGTLETARQAIALNFYVGVTGPVTYPKAEQKREIIRQLPITHLLIETDSPFLAPVPHRGKRNEPAYVLHIADKIAEIHSKSPAEVAAATTRNAARLFAWGD